MVVSPDGQLKFEAVQQLFQQLRKLDPAIRRSYGNHAEIFYRDFLSGIVPGLRAVENADGQMTIERLVGTEWKTYPAIRPVDYTNRIPEGMDLAAYTQSISSHQ